MRFWQFLAVSEARIGSISKQDIEIIFSKKQSLFQRNIYVLLLISYNAFLLIFLQLHVCNIFLLIVYVKYIAPFILALTSMAFADFSKSTVLPPLKR